MDSSLSITPYPNDLNVNDGDTGISAKRTCEYGGASGDGLEESESSKKHTHGIEKDSLPHTNGGYSLQSDSVVQPMLNLEISRPVTYNDAEDISVSEPISEGSIALGGSQWDMNSVSEFEEDTEERSLSESVSISEYLQAHAKQPNAEFGIDEAQFGGSGGNLKRNILPGNTEPLGEPDLVIEVTGGQRIKAHKSILAEKSDYFRARSSRDILKIKGVSYQTLQLLVDYIYNSKLEVKQENVVEVISGAKFLQIPCAVQCAMDSMRSQISLKNCYQVLYIAKKQRLNELKEAAYKFMSDHFLQVLRDPKVYGRLTGAERDLILQRRMDGKQFLVVAEINDAFERMSSSSRPQSRESSRPQSPSSSIVSFEDDAATYQVHCFNESARRWRSLTKIPEEANTKGCGVCVLYNYLFIAGGIKGSGEKAKLSDHVFCYNPLTDTWEKVRPLSQPRSQLKLIALDGYLYAIGGECLFTVEKYDPRMDRWSSVASLPKGAFAVAHEATTCNGEIYVSGGTLFYRLLKYDPKCNEWQECPYNNSRRRSAGMVSHKGCIYRFDVSREHGLSVFTYNSMARHWSEGVNLRPGPGPPPPTLPFRCTVMGSNIYCLNRAVTLRVPLPPEGTGGEMSSCELELFISPEEAKGVLFPFVLSLPENKSYH